MIPALTSWAIVEAMILVLIVSASYATTCDSGSYCLSFIRYYLCAQLFNLYVILSHISYSYISYIILSHALAARFFNCPVLCGLQILAFLQLHQKIHLHDQGTIL